jgi:hypothetical protein
VRRVRRAAGAAIRIVDRVEFAGEFTLRAAALQLQAALQERADVRWMNVEEQMR